MKHRYLSVVLVVAGLFAGCASESQSQKGNSDRAYAVAVGYVTAQGRGWCATFKSAGLYAQAAKAHEILSGAGVPKMDNAAAVAAFYTACDMTAIP